MEIAEELTVTRKEYPVVLHLPGFLKPGRCSIAILLLSIGLPLLCSFPFSVLSVCYPRAILARVVQIIHRRGAVGESWNRPPSEILEADATARGFRRDHHLPERIEYHFELGIVPFLKRVEFS